MKVSNRFEPVDPLLIRASTHFLGFFLSSPWLEGYHSLDSFMHAYFGDSETRQFSQVSEDSYTILKVKRSCLCKFSCFCRCHKSCDFKTSVRLEYPETFSFRSNIQIWLLLNSWHLILIKLYPLLYVSSSSAKISKVCNCIETTLNIMCMHKLVVI